jgi:hypothetical protein
MTSFFPSFIFPPSPQRTESIEAGVKVTKLNKPPVGPTRASLPRAVKTEAAKKAADSVLRFSEKPPKKTGLKSSSIRKTAAPKKIALKRDALPKVPVNKAASKSTEVRLKTKYTLKKIAKQSAKQLPPNSSKQGLPLKTPVSAKIKLTTTPPTSPGKLLTGVAFDPFATEQDYVPTDELMPEAHYPNNPTNPFSVAPPSIFSQAPASGLLGLEAHSLFGNPNGSSNRSGKLFGNLNGVTFGFELGSGSHKERGDGKRRVRKRRRESGRNNPLPIPHTSLPQSTDGIISGEHPGHYPNHTDGPQGGSEHLFPYDLFEKSLGHSSTQKPSASKRGRGRKKKTSRKNHIPTTWPDVMSRGFIPFTPPSRAAPGFSSALVSINPALPGAAFALFDPIFPVTNKKKANRRRRSRK